MKRDWGNDARFLQHSVELTDLFEAVKWTFDIAPTPRPSAQILPCGRFALTASWWGYNYIAVSRLLG